MTYTVDQVNANREYIDNECVRIQKVCNNSNLTAAVVFHWDPLCNKLETRVGYFEDILEAKFWKEEKEETYKTLDLDYSSYIIFPVNI